MTPPTAEDTLARWRDRAAELETRAGPYGVARPDQFAGRTGLQTFAAMLAGELPRAPIAQTLGFQLVEAGAGHAEFQGAPLRAHYNPLGTVHGGWIATLLDSAVGCAVHTMLPAGKAYTTLELKVNYVKALSEKVPLVRAVGRIVHFGGRVATSEGRLIAADGTLYAHATTTCLIFDAK